MTQTDTTCPYCGVGCGVSAKVVNGQPQPVSGLEQHPANLGRLCVKGSALHETLGHDGRLLQPFIDAQPVSWDHALDTVSRRIQQVIQQHGPQAVAFYGSGQLLTEDYYVANKLMKGFIGSANMDTNSRLCMASAVVGYKRAFGSDTVPGCYQDLEQTDLLLLVGSNAAWAHPVLFQRIRRAKAQNPAMKVVVIDPRRTASCDIADLHLALRPGSDVWLFQGLLAYLSQHDGLDQDFIEQHCQQFETTLQQALAQAANPEQVAQQCDLDVAQLRTCYQWFRDSRRCVSLYSMGVNQSRCGSDKANAIINVHLASGKIGKPGSCPFSITGQPNAMGGREVGGLANQLAAHMDFNADDCDRVQRFWQSPGIARSPGLKAIDLFAAAERGDIKFLWIMSTNPVVSMPDADRIKRALANVDTVVVSDCMADTDTMQYADIGLPAASWGEKNGTVSNSERRISRQRGFLPPPGEARPDWWIISQVGQRLGYRQQFDYHHPADIFREHARLSAFENNGQRDFDLSALTELNQAQYDALTPLQWPVNERYPNGRQRLFDDGHFYTATGKAQFVPLQATAALSVSQPPGRLIMNSGRIRDHWHTMTRTGQAARLNQHISEPFALLHPQDAKQRQLSDGQLVEVSNQRGRLLLRARVSDEQRHGEVFVPMHWSDRYSARARVSSLIDNTHDPLSGQPQLKISLVQARAYHPDWQATVFSRDDISRPGQRPLLQSLDYWASGRNEQGFFCELASRGDSRDWLQALRQQMAQQSSQPLHWVSFDDPKRRHYRRAAYDASGLVCLVYCRSGGQNSSLLNRAWLSQQLATGQPDSQLRMALLNGHPPGPQQDQGAIICSCFQVGDKAIQAAINAGHNNPEALGQQLRCGTNCGSCLPELQHLCDATAPTEIA
ncbi:nitrate reductase [Bacterioplanoides pacificum]|uniref:Molybdopterin-dependent oxidoreductase n=1 Tax=Bacterioplanoides pacificum TaxID=1171596 RepID=A0ABV7VQL7_9GAMM